MMPRPVLSPYRAAGGVGLVAMLAACTSMSGLDGRTDYACQAPPGVQCNSVSGNYANAIHNNLPTQRQAAARAAADSPTAAALRVSSPQPIAADAPATGKRSATPTTDLAAPLRSPPQLLRLWVKAWEDADHDLVDQAYVYLQVDAGHWLLDHVHQRVRDAYAPLRPPRAAASPSPASSATAVSAAPPLFVPPRANGLSPSRPPGGGAPMN